SCGAAGWTGGLGVRIIVVAFAAVPVLAGRVAFPTGRRADFDTFFVVARTLFAPFFAAWLVVFADRPAVFVECSLIISI
ncbi:MAG: hypothetical protein WA693_11565, partial [Pseudolabrys sp.]